MVFCFYCTWQDARFSSFTQQKSIHGLVFCQGVELNQVAEGSAQAARASNRRVGHQGDGGVWSWDEGWKLYCLDAVSSSVSSPPLMKQHLELGDTEVSCPELDLYLWLSASEQKSPGMWQSHCKWSAVSNYLTDTVKQTSRLSCEDGQKRPSFYLDFANNQESINYYIFNSPVCVLPLFRYPLMIKWDSTETF